ncbi:gp101 [Corynebacterium phage P1201]|uniref:Gp101 n=1 Tax=Corynebacterium phage P1201 TaxID=384848 RepID=A7IYG8_9CAUD|nr:gp101 [Corynebacterium phage P1201]ABF57551.1 gp101 [Corynebacterium phage P1201]
MTVTLIGHRGVTNTAFSLLAGHRGLVLRVNVRDDGYCRDVMTSSRGCCPLCFLWCVVVGGCVE